MEGLNTKILDKITAGIRFRTNLLENGKTEYIVERKSLDDSGWDVLAKTTKIERALMKKHNAWHAQIHLLHLREKLMSRRKLGKGSLLQLLRR